MRRLALPLLCALGLACGGAVAEEASPGASASEAEVAVADAEIAERAQGFLRLAPTLARHRLHVAVDDGRAVLTGTVASEEESAEAEEIVRRTRGVTSVANELHVAPEAP